MVAWSELILGSIAGVVVGAPLGALARPPIAAMERFARRLWREKPLLIHVEHDPSIIWTGSPDWVPFTHYFPRGIPAGPVPTTRDDWLKWVKDHDGVDAVVTQLSVTLQAKSETAVVVESLRVKDRRSAVHDGIILTRGVGGADLIPRRFRVDLDWGGAPIVFFESAGGGESEEFPSVSLSPREIERFHIWIEASRDRHEWTLELLLLVEGRRITHRIDNSGRPFITVGIENLPHRSNLAGTETWTPWPEL